MGKKKIESKLIKFGSNPLIHHGSLSDPIYKTSTIIFNSYKDFLKARKNRLNLPYYGRFGNYTTKRFEKIANPDSKKCSETSCISIGFRRSGLSVP